ncbi:MAG TPA: IPExxxVDY family protein [Cyclobacteriaceae bacterium]|nr:IPExxxVDY family protein [Cyclobacteriaceae bacterium]
MKKKKLEAEYTYDFELIGITSAVRPHKIAWELNRALDIKLSRKEDLILQFKSGDEKSYIMLEYETPLSIIKLFRNKPNEIPSNPSKHCLVIEYPHFDYILLIKSIENDFGNNLTDSLKKIACIEYVGSLSLNAIKAKENFIF